MRIYVLLIALALTSCQPKQRAPGSVQTDDLATIIETLHRSAQEGVSSSKDCHLRLTDVYNAFLNLTIDSSLALDLTKKDKEDLIRKSFLTRLEIKEKLKQLRIENQIDVDCLGAVKDVVRAMRYVEDYMIEVFYPLAQEEDFDTFKTAGIHFLVNPKFEKKFKTYQDLKSGDVILSRGGAYSSAAIARIGTHDTQFSHLILVYKDPKTKRLQTVEAHIEVGSLTQEMQKVLDERHARAMLFRYPDEVMAHQAAEIMFKRVRAVEQTGERIPYDFSMDYQDGTTLFCSEIIYEGFKKASDGKLDIPDHKTQFNPDLLPFLKLLGIKVTEQNVDTFKTFAPGDIQFDSQFEVVAEFRNPAKLRDSREKDAILTKIFEWMAESDYSFRPPLGIRTKTMVSWLLRRTPIAQRFLDEKFPLNMSRDQLKLFLVLDDVGKVLQNHIHELQSKLDLPLTPQEIYSHLEDYRREDALRFKIYTEKNEELSRLNQFDRDSRDHFKEFRLRREIKENKPHFHQWFRDK